MASASLVIERQNFTINNLQENTKYYWRLKAANIAGESNWSEIWSFTTGTPTRISDWEKTNAESLKIFPNPTTGLFRVQYLTFNVNCIEIVDLNGRILEIFNCAKENRNPEFDISHLKPGVYLCRITSDLGAFVSKLVLK